MKELINRSALFKSCNGCTKRSDTCHKDCVNYATEVILGICVEAQERAAINKRLDEYSLAQKRAYRLAKRSAGIKRHMRGNSYLKSR